MKSLKEFMNESASIHDIHASSENAVEHAKKASRKLGIKFNHLDYSDTSDGHELEFHSEKSRDKVFNSLGYKKSKDGEYRHKNFKHTTARLYSNRQHEPNGPKDKDNVVHSIHFL